MYLTTGVYKRLEHPFTENGLSLCVKSGYVIVENSQRETEERIAELVRSVGFCPLVSRQRLNNNIVFTIAPHTQPEFFNETLPFSREDGYRAIVAPAFKQGLAEIIAGYRVGELIEIEGNFLQTFTAAERRALGVKSTLNEEVDLDKLDHDQPCLFLSFNSFFGATSSDRRLRRLQERAQFQIPGDYTVAILDAGPNLSMILRELEALHPGCAILPYSSNSVIIVPAIHGFPNPSLEQFCHKMREEVCHREMRLVSPFQQRLEQLQSEFGLEVIEFEQFFIRQMRSEMERAGYSVRVYYHASFTVAAPTAAISATTQDLIYKAVTDSGSLIASSQVDSRGREQVCSVRQWSLTDSKLISQLRSKGISLPAHFDEPFLRNLRASGQKILGAEFLVIEGKKI